MNIDEQPECLITEQQQLQVEKTMHRESEQIINEIVDNVMEKSVAQIEENAFMSKYFLAYSSKQTLGKINQVGDLLYVLGLKMFPQPTQEEEPTPLYVDSLLPISADIDSENQYKKNMARFNNLSESAIRTKNNFRSSRLEQKEPHYVQLQMTEASEEDNLTIELRKQSQEKNKKMEGQKKIKEKLERLRL